MGGAACKVEPDRCSLVGVDFLGAMEVDLWSISAKTARKMRGDVEGAAEKTLEGKTIGHVGIYRPKIFVALSRRRVSTRRCRYLRCCVPESGQGDSQQRRMLRLCKPESYSVEICARYAAA